MFDFFLIEYIDFDIYYLQNSLFNVNFVSFSLFAIKIFVVTVQKKKHYSIIEYN